MTDEPNIQDDIREEPEFVEPTPIADSDGEYRCELCGYKAKNPHGLAIHMGRQHGDSERPKSPGFSSPRGRGGNTALRDQANEFATLIYGLGGQLVAQANPPIGMAVQQCGPAAAEAWYRAALHNRRVRALITGTGPMSVWIGLVMVHMPILLAVQQQVHQRIQQMEEVSIPDTNEP